MTLLAVNPLHLYGCDAPAEKGEVKCRAGFAVDEPGAYSQFSEDAIIERLLEPIPTPHTVIDIGAYDGVTLSNSRRMIERGATAVLIDADPAEAAKASALYEGHERVTVCEHYATPGTIEAYLGSVGAPMQPDVVSIDVDGQDIWLMASLGDYAPRILVVEFAPLPLTRTVGGGAKVSVVPVLDDDAPSVDANGAYVYAQAGPAVVGMAGAALGYTWIASTFCNMIFVADEHLGAY